jgi:hypothetical protein
LEVEVDARMYIGPSHHRTAQSDSPSQLVFSQLHPLVVDEREVEICVDAYSSFSPSNLTLRSI